MESSKSGVLRVNSKLEAAQQDGRFPYCSLAFVIDGEIVQIMSTDERMAAILLSNPDIVDITGEPHEMVKSETYDVTTKTFKNPSA